MSWQLGIDTGGTYTDAVLVAADGEREIVATAKSRTTHHDLVRGVAAAISAVLERVPSIDPSAIDLVSVSTTLVTNALVEGHGEPAGLISVGFADAELQRIGLDAAVDPDHLVVVDGGHDAHGHERSPVDLDVIRSAVERVGDGVSGWAVAAQFSVRNNAHELAVRDAIRSSRPGSPVSCSHELSARLDGPRRALTAVLNARLIGRIGRLNEAVRAALASAGIDAPLMVVRGDGSLVSAAFAEARPIETMLSGPAASVIGASWLTEIDDGLVVDIGGTTTDVAVIEAGRPRIAADGAVVGGHRTMVEAVDMATGGIGGDSEVWIDTRHADGPVLIGPARAIPIGRLAADEAAIAEQLRRQLGEPMALSSHGRFLVAEVAPSAALDEREREVLERLGAGPLGENEAAPSALAARAVARLRARGLVRVATFTPTDALAVLGRLDGDAGLDSAASQAAAQILSQKTAANGGVIAADGEAFAALVADGFERASASFVLRAALAADGIDVPGNAPLLEAALDGSGPASRVSIGLAHSVTAIGAPASAWYPGVAARLGVPHRISEQAPVANAIGAIVGDVRVRRSVTVTQPTKGQFRVHLDDQPAFGSVDNARAHATERLEALVRADAEQAGATTPEVTADWQQRTAVVNGKEVFVEGTLTVQAQGRPRF